MKAFWKRVSWQMSSKLITNMSLRLTGIRYDWGLPKCLPHIRTFWKGALFGWNSVAKETGSVVVVLVAQTKILRNRDQREVELFCTRALMIELVLFSLFSFVKRGEALLWKRQDNVIVLVVHCVSYHLWDTETFVRVYMPWYCVHASLEIPPELNEKCSTRQKVSAVVAVACVYVVSVCCACVCVFRNHRWSST